MHSTSPHVDLSSSDDASYRSPLQSSPRLSLVTGPVLNIGGDWLVCCSHVFPAWRLRNRLRACTRQATVKTYASSCA